MIVDHGPNGARAEFSADRRFRYTLTRRLFRLRLARTTEDAVDRACTFVMLNPSTADAFKLDPTVRRCYEFAERWGFDELRVVNLFALRSPHPRDLYAAYATEVDPLNEQAIAVACKSSARVVAAWGNHGHDKRLGARGARIRSMLELAGVELLHLGTTSSGAPLHPLARGKSWIPKDRDPVRWVA